MRSVSELLPELEGLKLKIAESENEVKMLKQCVQKPELLHQPTGSALSSNKSSRGAATLPRATRICPASAFEVPDEVDSGEAVGTVKVCCAW